MQRNDILSSLKANPEVPVLIVGGGINGIGTLRDLALNGVDVLLVERADFCSGASSASSHMAHGGIRYLENGEFRLVREAVNERNRLIENAPHLVKPLPTTIPIFKWFSGSLNAPLKFLGLLSRPTERGAVVIKLGLLLYDAFTGRARSVPRHHFHSRKESLKRWNSLNPQVVATATYYDGAILSPERLAIEVLLEAEAENPNARALNYVSLVSGEDGNVTLRDELTNETLVVRPQLLVNATGAWIDFVNHDLGQSTRFIGGAKGSHLVLAHDELRKAIGEHEFFFENEDGRIVLIFPLFERVLVGTTDIPIARAEARPEEARCTDEERDYLLGMVQRVFPAIKVTPEQIVFQFSGVRPLPYSGAKSAGQISRDHSIQVISGGWTGLSFPVYSLVGGKWTTFRAFAEQVTDKVLDYLGRTRDKHTRALPIGGGRGYPRSEQDRRRQIESLCAWTGLPAERVQGLFERYGTRAEQVADFISRGQDEPLKSLPNYSHREIEFLAGHEKIVHLDDLVLRRSLLGMLGKLTRERVEELSNALGDAQAWEPDRRKAEAARLLSILADRHGARL